MRAPRQRRLPRRHLECGAPAPPRYGQGRARPRGHVRPPRAVPIRRGEAAGGAALKCGAGRGPQRWRRAAVAHRVPSAAPPVRHLAVRLRRVWPWGAALVGPGGAAGAQPGARSCSLAWRPWLPGKCGATPSDAGRFSPSAAPTPRPLPPPARP